MRCCRVTSLFSSSCLTRDGSQTCWLLFLACNCNSIPKYRARESNAMTTTNNNNNCGKTTMQLGCIWGWPSLRGCVVGSARLQQLTLPMPASTLSPGFAWERARLLVVVHFIFILASLSFIHSLFWHRVIVPLSSWLLAPAVEAVAAASGCSGRILVSVHPGKCASLKTDCVYLFILLFITAFWFFFSCSGEWRETDPRECRHKRLIVGISNLLQCWRLQQSCSSRVPVSGECFSPCWLLHFLFFVSRSPIDSHAVDCWYFPSCGAGSGGCSGSSEWHVDIIEGWLCF